MNHKIKVAFIYKKSYTFLSGKHFDNTTYHFFMNALKRNSDIVVSYFPSYNKFNVSKIKDQFDIILLPHNNTDGTPDELEGIHETTIPVICRIGDPHRFKEYNLIQFHEKFKIDYYFNFTHEDYFYKFYPKEFNYKTIIFGLEPALYASVPPFNDRIKNKILNSGAVANQSYFSKIAIKMMHGKNNNWQHYKLRTICNNLQYVVHTNTLEHEYINDKYPLLLSKYAAAIAATTHFPTIKYLEVPAAGCLTFMEITEHNLGKYLGFTDRQNAIFINEKNYKERFEEFLSDPNNPKWEQIANAGRNYALQELSNDKAVESLVQLMKDLL